MTMKHIWSPWRMEFIERPKLPKGCIFCGKRGRKDLILHMGKNCFIIMNRYPYNNGHLMIVPFVHKGELSELSPAVQCELMWLTGESVKILKKVLKCQGANCGMNLGSVAGAGVAGHVHMHVVPRWLGDSNFMPVIAGTKSMPEYLEATFKKLMPAFNKLKNVIPRSPLSLQISGGQARG